MSEELFDLIFRGEIAKNMDAVQTRQNVQQLFKIPADKVDALFSGKAVVLKRGLNMEAANKYRVAIKKAGALVDVVAQTPAASSGSVSAVEQVPVINPAQAGLSDVVSTSEQGVIAAKKIKVPDFSVAPVGADVLNPNERSTEKQVEFDLSAFSVRSADGLLLDPSETQSDVELNIEVDWSIAPAGSDILTADQRAHEEKLDLDLSALSLAEVGVKLVETKSENVVAPDVSHLSLK